MLSPSGGCRCEQPQPARFGLRIVKECVGRAGTAGRMGGGSGVENNQTRQRDRRGAASSGSDHQLEAVLGRHDSYVTCYSYNRKKLPDLKLEYCNNN